MINKKTAPLGCFCDVSAFWGGVINLGNKNPRVKIAGGDEKSTKQLKALKFNLTIAVLTDHSRRPIIIGGRED